MKVDEWGKKRLAFEIKDEQEGVYYVLYFEAPTEALDEVTRVLGITDGVLRFMPIRHDKPFSLQAPAARAEEAEDKEAEE